MHRVAYSRWVQPRRGYTNLVVLAVRVAATVLGQEAALAVHDVALVAQAALHAVLVAVPLAAGRGTLGRTHGHAAGVVAVGRAAQHWRGAGDRWIVWYGG